MNTTGAAVSFPEWKVCLRAVTSGDEQRAYFAAIVGFLRHCKERRCGASVGVAKAYVEAQSVKGDEITRLALRWFFRAALSRAKREGAGNAGAGLMVESDERGARRGSTGVEPQGAGLPRPKKTKEGVGEGVGADGDVGAPGAASREREPYGRRDGERAGGRVEASPTRVVWGAADDTEVVPPRAEAEPTGTSALPGWMRGASPSPTRGVMENGRGAA